jgi:sterol desaturase/sphingolipid hydroxylase (fatty acid hydroxylase superfamily)
MESGTADPQRKSATGVAAISNLFSRLSVTRFNARAGLMSDVVIGLALLAAGLAVNTFGIAIAVATIATGLLVFSFVEYCFHRWLFHVFATPARDGHDKHHADPQGYDALPFFMPPLAMLALAGGLALIAPLSTALLLSGALASGYAAYGVAHTIIHAVRFRRALPKRWAAHHHVHHHHSGSNYGVTTPLWDILLGTRYVSARHAGSVADPAAKRSLP